MKCGLRLCSSSSYPALYHYITKLQVTSSFFRCSDSGYTRFLTQKFPLLICMSSPAGEHPAWRCRGVFAGCYGGLCSY